VVDAAWFIENPCQAHREGLRNWKYTWTSRRPRRRWL